MVRRFVRIQLLIGLLSVALGVSPVLVYAEDDSSRGDWGPAMEQTRTLFAPNETHTENGFILPHETRYGCSTGDIVDISKDGTVVGQISTISDNSNKKYTDTDIQNDPNLRYCTTVPFWLLGANDLLLQEKNPGLLLDTLKINGQRLFKGATSYQYAMDNPIEGNPTDLGPSHYLPGIFPLELNLTYQQIPTTHPPLVTLGELLDLTSHMPDMLSIQTLANVIAGDLGVALATPVEKVQRGEEIPNSDGTLLGKVFGQRFTFLSEEENQPDRLAYTTNIYRLPLYDHIQTLLTGIQTNTSTFWKNDGGVATVVASALQKNSSGNLTTPKTIPTFTIAHDEVGVYPTGADRMHTYLDDSLVLQPMFRLFSEGLERQLRPAADFFCKYSFEGPSRDVPIVGGKIQLNDDTMPFVDGAWKSACATLSGYSIDRGTEFAMLAPYVDRTFNTFAYINGGQRYYTNYLRARTPLAEQSVANKNTAHMDWFGAAAHCMARGGRLPETEELLTMAVDAATTSNSRFFNDYPHNNDEGSSMQAVGSFVYAGDFVKGTNATDGQKGPYVTALFLPPVGKANKPIQYNPTPLDGNRYEYHQCESGGDQTIANIAGGIAVQPSSYVDWAGARLCRVSLHTRPAGAVQAQVSTTDPQYLLAQVTDPAPSAEEVEYLPSPYRTNGVTPETGKYWNLSPISRAPSTHVICVYE